MLAILPPGPEQNEALWAGRKGHELFKEQKMVCLEAAQPAKKLAQGPQQFKVTGQMRPETADSTSRL